MGNLWVGRRADLGSGRPPCLCLVELAFGYWTKSPPMLVQADQVPLFQYFW
jgi:hypothetical protein